MKLSKMFLVLSLVIGLIMVAGSVKAATSYDNVPGEIVAGIWVCTKGDIETVFMIKNTNNVGTSTTPLKFHYGIYDENSDELTDGILKFTAYDSTGLVLKVKSDGDLYLITDKYESGGTKETNIATPTADADGYYTGYIVIYNTDNISTASNPIAMSSSIYAASEKWYTGLNCISVQDETVTSLDAARSALDANLKEGTWFGRWYSEKDNYWKGAFLLCCPGDKDSKDKYSITGENYDENEKYQSFTRTIKEVERVPIKSEYTNKSNWIPVYSDANSGWIHIKSAKSATDNETVGMFGFFILEKSDTNAADVLPLWHSE